MTKLTIGKHLIKYFRVLREPIRLKTHMKIRKRDDKDLSVFLEALKTRLLIWSELEKSFETVWISKNSLLNEFIYFMRSNRTYWTFPECLEIHIDVAFFTDFFYSKFFSFLYIARSKLNLALVSVKMWLLKVVIVSVTINAILCRDLVGKVSKDSLEVIFTS